MPAGRHNIVASIVASIRTRIPHGLPRSSFVLKGVAVAICSTLGAPEGFASPAVSQAVSAPQAIVDEFGEALHGTSSSSSLFGITPVEGDVVQILLATDSTIYPPSADGTPDPRNLLLQSSRIGAGTSPSMDRSGLFSAAVSPRPGGNSKIFVRVLNASSVEEASFYGDSQLFTVKSWKNEIFKANITATSEPIDTGDDDGDGLNNSWERSFGTDREMADSDMDGISDADEIAAQTDPLDPSSLLKLTSIEPLSDGSLKVKWSSVPGMQYVVDACDDLCHDQPFTTVGTVTASSDTSEFVLQPSEALEPKGLRVCVMP